MVAGAMGGMPRQGILSLAIKDKGALYNAYMPFVRGGGLFASQKIELSERPPIAGGPSLTIETRGPGGTLRVRARPTVKATIKQITRAIGH